MTSNKELLAFRKVQNEIIEGVIHSICVMIDGGDQLADDLLIDLIEREIKNHYKKTLIYTKNLLDAYWMLKRTNTRCQF